MRRVKRPLSVVVILIFILMSVNPSVFAARSTIGYWKFNENTNGGITYDSSGYSNNGLMNDTIWGQGKSGTAIEFKGRNSYVTVPTNANLNFTDSQSFTISTWVYIPTLRNRMQGVITKGSAALSSEWYGIWINQDNKWMFGANGNNIIGPKANTGWSHIAVVQDGAARKRYLYINGGLAASGNSSGGVSNCALWFGGTNGLDEYFWGRLDETYLRNYALSENSVSYEYELYNSKLLGYWGFDEDNGTMSIDTSGNCRIATFKDIVGWDVGKNKSCMSIYSGNGRVTVSESYSFNFSKYDNFTITAWVYIPSLMNQWQGVITKGRGKNQWYGIWITPRNNWCFGSDQENIIGSSVTKGWHHVAITQNGYTQKRYIFIDGVRQGEGVSSDCLATDVVTFGNSGINEQFTGKIDEVSFYNYWLSDTDISNDYSKLKDKFDYNLSVPCYTQRPYGSLCWATCASMVSSYFNKDTIDRKLDIAKDLFGQTDFNKPAYMSDVNNAVNKYSRHKGVEYQSTLSSGDIMASIDEKRPLIASIQWSTGGVGHDLVISGYVQKSLVSKHIWVIDPSDGQAHDYVYDYFKSNNSFKWDETIKF
ncbi:MAG TPA: LamG-like jellyroll fold domain-containing protein [Clostridia bacterium]